MSNLFIVRSPLQLINCLEAIEYFNIQDDNNILVIIYNNTNNTNIQMDDLVKNYNWQNIIRVNQKKKKSKFFEYISLIKELKSQDYNYLFFGDFGSIYKLIIANTTKNKVWYVDDGIGTLKHYEEVIVPNKINKFTSRMFRFVLFGLKINIKDDINLFTYFDLKSLQNTKVVINNLENFRTKYMSQSTLDDTTYLLGQPLSETNLLSEDDYFEYLEYIIDKFENKIVYIPHRTEQIGDRHKSYVNDKFEIRDIGMPIELYFLEQKIEPYHIISFMTTAFFTLEKLYSQTKYSYIYIPSDKILERAEDVQRAYDLISKCNIQKIEI
jgi:hypothetical protein